ncbi:hypothetical protein Pfo_025434 [Paulownia fortunei]|nr:hypothetical protein Pfo_025434 [Paulownia fortunei]
MNVNKPSYISLWITTLIQFSWALSRSFPSSFDRETGRKWLMGASFDFACVREWIGGCGFRRSDFEKFGNLKRGI